jgi:cyclopropane-fatty-acyl-phospholipid synthase
VAIVTGNSSLSGCVSEPCHADTVVTCYSVVDRFFPPCGLLDLTEGIYHGDPATPYHQAQANQCEYLLDQARCTLGARVLEIGCGYGTLLARMRERGATGTGISISPEQVRHCRDRQLDAQLRDYRALPGEWDTAFDSVIANGSMEHFVGPTDVIAHQADAIYTHLFATVHRAINPRSAARRFVTTTIHHVRRPADPRDSLKSPFAFPWGSDAFHWAVLERGWGGYYPELGQLRRCAEGYFELGEEVDGTEDYRLTSEAWSHQVRRALRSRRILPIAARSLPVLMRAPRQFVTLVLALLLTESWNWQFRPPNPPTRLLRQTWIYQDRG